LDRVEKPRPESIARFVGFAGVGIEIEEGLHALGEEDDVVAQPNEWIPEVPRP